MIIINNKTPHDINLTAIVRNLELIGENPRKVHWIMKEGIWLNHNTKEQRSLCDIIIAYQDNIPYVPVELKGNIKYKDKAIDQLYAGKVFIEHALDYYSDYGVFVLYQDRELTYERIYF